MKFIFRFVIWWQSIYYQVLKLLTKMLCIMMFKWILILHLLLGKDTEICHLVVFEKKCTKKPVCGYQIIKKNNSSLNNSKYVKIWCRSMCFFAWWIDSFILFLLKNLSRPEYSVNRKSLRKCLQTLSESDRSFLVDIIMSCLL